MTATTPTTGPKVPGTPSRSQATMKLRWRHIFTGTRLITVISEASVEAIPATAASSPTPPLAKGGDRRAVSDAPFWKGGDRRAASDAPFWQGGRPPCRGDPPTHPKGARRHQRWGARASRPPFSASRRKPPDGNLPPTSRRDADRSDRDGRAPQLQLRRPG